MARSKSSQAAAALQTDRPKKLPKVASKPRRRNKQRALVLPKFEVLPDGGHAITMPVHTECFVNGSQGFSKGATFAAARAKKAQREAVAAHLFCIGREFRGVTMVRIAPPTWRKGLDTGNLWNALKAVQDQIAEHLGCDDGPTSPATWDVEQEEGPEYGVRVELRRERRHDWKLLRDAIARVLQACAANEMVSAAEIRAAIGEAA
jgi:alpha-L-arabinofuranosidase